MRWIPNQRSFENYRLQKIERKCAFFNRFSGSCQSSVKLFSFQTGLIQRKFNWASPVLQQDNNPSKLLIVQLKCFHRFQKGNTILLLNNEWTVKVCLCILIFVCSAQSKYSRRALSVFNSSNTNIVANNILALYEWEKNNFKELNNEWNNSTFVDQNILILDS